MSRIGHIPVEIPKGVDVQIAGQILKAKGKFGELSVKMGDEIEAKVENGEVVVAPKADADDPKRAWGTARSLIKSVITGVAEGYTRQLEITGVGYRAQMQGKTKLVLQLGFSHEVNYPVEAGITIETPDQTHIVVKGADKQRVGQVAAEIRGFRPPEPYKGKGIHYQGEYILRKEGKKK
jgi:large subunit ribosomal protein L6